MKISKNTMNMLKNFSDINMSIEVKGRKYLENCVGPKKYSCTSDCR